MIFPTLLTLAAELAQPLQQAARAPGMTEEVKLAVTVGASLLLAAIVAVFYLGRKVGQFGAQVTAFGVQVKSFEEATRESTRLGEKWNTDLLAALREVDERVVDALSRVAELEHKQREAKDLPGRMKALEEWRREIDTRFEERHRYENSRRNVVEEAAPVDDLFEASGKREDD
jgi:flagellar motility protein MotE (MotC chaperone)